MGLVLKCLVLLVLLLGVVNCQEKDLGTLIKGLKSKDDATRKDSLHGLEKRASYSEYSVGEIEKRGAVPLLLKILEEENGNPLVKELVMATLAKMTKFSHHVGNSLLNSNFITVCPVLLRRGTVTAQEHTITVLSNIAKIGPSQKAQLAGTPALEAFVYVLKSGTPAARESAAGLVSILSQDATARARFAELDVETLLTKITVSGTSNAKKVAAQALHLLHQPISVQSTKLASQKQQTTTTTQTATPTYTTTTTTTTTTKPASTATYKATSATAQVKLDLEHDFIHSSPSSSSYFPSSPSASLEETDSPKSPPKKQKGFVNNYRLRSPARTSHI